MANLITSLASTTDSETPAPTSWWLKSPTDPTLNRAVNVSGWSPTQRRPVAKYDPAGRSRSVVLRGPVMGDEGTLSLRTLSSAEAAAVTTLLESQVTLLLQNVLNEQWYVEVGGDIGRTQVRAGTTEAYPVRHFYEWQIPLVEVDSPS